MKKIIKAPLVFILVFFVSIVGFSQTTDTIYFDKDWKETDRENHEFYRPLPLKTIGKLSLVIDYYKNGKMQMQAYAYTDSLDTDESLKKYVGDIYWYTQSGFDSYTIFCESHINDTLRYYHHNGTLWKEVPYKNGLKDGISKIYDNKNRLRYTQIYQQGKVANNMIDCLERDTYFGADDIYTSYWLDSPHKARIIHCSKEAEIIKEDIYSKTGDLIKSYKASDFIHNTLKKGTYYQEKTENGFVVDFETGIKNFQSKIIEINDVDYFDYESFVKKKSPNQFQYIGIDLYYNDTVPEKCFEVDTSEVYEDIDQDSKWISVKKIKQQSVDQLLKTLSEKQWEKGFKEKEYYSDDFIQHKIIFKPFNESLFVDLELHYDRLISGGFGSYYVSDDDDKQKWRVSDVKLYTINVIVINGKRPILALSRRNEFKYVIIPLKDGSFYTNYNEENEIDMKLKNNTPLHKDIVLELMRYKDAKAFYNIVTKKQKKYIANEFNEVLIDMPYDSIQRVSQFIICRHKQAIDIYNLRLEKLPLKDIREVYVDRRNLQVLSGNKTFFVNALGELTGRQYISYSFCGTVSSSDFLIIDSIKTQPNIKINHGMAMSFVDEEYIFLTNLSNKQDITFLNKTKKDYYDENSFCVEGYINRTQTLVVKDNNQFGLYTYSKDLKYDFDDKGNRFAKTKAKELLPITYDSIELREPLIILQKDNKLGIYEDKKGLIYKNFGKVDANFMRYEKLNGEQGWVDVNTLQDYPDE